MSGGRRLAVAAAILAVLALAGWALWGAPQWAAEIDAERLGARLRDAGPLGPALIVGLMTLAIVFSPIPSAPIALAAGAVYGHVWGTAYIVIGAEAGALLAFAIARVLGHDALRRWFGPRLEIGLLGSQNALMATVFVSRLLPFVSFDVVSYAAGLSALHLWRFALATLAGIVPASFLLAHFGEELARADPARIGATVLALGLVTGVPLAVLAWRRRRR